MKPHQLLPIVVALLLLALVDRALAQASVELDLVAIDAAAFPTVALDLIVTDEALSPVTDLRALTVREAGQIISAIAVSRVPAGVGLTIVLDANQGLDVVDAGSDVSRLEQARQGILRYADVFMSPSGLDRVDIIVPDGDEAAFLVQEASDPQAVVTAIEGYAPAQLPALTPLNAMMELALTTAGDRAESGQFQAILLLTNGSELDRQLDYATLVDEAIAWRLPIFAAILGSRADPDEVANVARLYEPTRGFYVHMPVPLDADPIFTAVQAHATRARVTYTSLARRSGVITVTVALGAEVVTGSYRLALEPPRVELALEAAEIVRVAPSPTSALFQLQPVSLTVPAAISWPDGIARSVVAAELIVDGVVVASASEPALRDGVIGLTWNLRAADVGDYQVVIQVVDEFGQAARSAPATLTVRTRWPEPTPVPVTSTPTATATPPPPGAVAAVVWREIPAWLRIALPVGAGLAGLILLYFLARTWRRRRALRQQLLVEAEALADALPPPEPEPEPPPPGHARLEILAHGAPHQSNVVYIDESVTLGRDPAVADVVFTDPSVSRLHARLRRSDGRYWLYDEGSAAGTYLNYKRVGLMPQPIEAGDDIHIGQVHLRFHWDPGYHSAT